MCHITNLYDLYLDDHDDVKMLCRVQKESKKGRKKFSTAPVFKYGVEVSRNPEHTANLDEKNGNMF